MKRDADIVERVAKAIYASVASDGVVSDVVWRLPHEPPWDTDPRELTEWQRDEYRAMAGAAIEAMATTKNLCS